MTCMVWGTDGADEPGAAISSPWDFFTECPTDFLQVSWEGEGGVKQRRVQVTILGVWVENIL